MVGFYLPRGRVTIDFNNCSRLFIIEGCTTAFIGVAGFWLLPDTPSTTRWLEPEERDLAHARIERDKMGEPEQASMMEGLRQACRDKRTWVFCLMQNFHLSACGFNSFFPTYVLLLSKTITPKYP